MADFQPQQRQVRPNALEPALPRGPIRRDHHGIVDVTGIVDDLQRALAEVVQAVEVQVAEGLAQQVADGHARGVGTLSEHHGQIDRAAALDDTLQQGAQDGPVDAVEVAAHIHMQRPGTARRPTHGGLQPVGGLVRSAPHSTGKTRGDVAPLQVWRNDRVDGVLHDQVAKRWRLDQAGLARVIHHESGESRWLIPPLAQILLNAQDVRAAVPVELIRGAVAALVAPRLVPRGDQRVRGPDALDEIANPLHAGTRIDEQRAKAPVFARRPATRPTRTTKGRNDGPFRHKPRRWLPRCRTASAALGLPSIESAANPTLLLEFVRSLFRLRLRTPALEPLFQFPREITQSMSSHHRTCGRLLTAVEVTAPGWLAGLIQG